MLDQVGERVNVDGAQSSSPSGASGGENGE
jgi:hypothetical protein